MDEKLFTHRQILVGSFFGGPFAPALFFKKNFMTMGDSSKAKNVFSAWVLFGILLLFFLILWLEDLEWLPDYLIPSTYTIFAQAYAEEKNMSKKYILDEGRFDFKSNWDVAIISAGSLALFFCVGFLIVLITDFLGIA